MEVKLIVTSLPLHPKTRGVPPEVDPVTARFSAAVSTAGLDGFKLRER